VSTTTNDAAVVVPQSFIASIPHTLTDCAPVALPPLKLSSPDTLTLHAFGQIRHLVAVASPQPLYLTALVPHF